MGGGLLLSFPRINQAKISHNHEEIALERVPRCLWLTEGTIREGYYYAHLLDPSKQWSRNGKPTIEGDLVSGINQSLCDRTGQTAQFGPNGVAQNIRNISPQIMGEKFVALFPDGVHYTRAAVLSDRYKPNFEQRQQRQNVKPGFLKIN